MKRRPARANVIALPDRDINGLSTFAQPPFKFVELGLQVAEVQRRLAGRGYDGRIIRVEGYSTWYEGKGKTLT